MRQLLQISVLLLATMLVACSSGIKDYSKATPLKDFDEQLKVMTLWVNDTVILPEYSFRQLKPVVQDDVLYYANVTGMVSAVNAATGSTLWRTPLNEILSGGPGAGEGLVIVGTRKAEIVALDIAHGKEVWRGKISTEMLTQPKLARNKVILQAADGEVTALDSKTGKMVWNYRHEIPSLSLRGTSTPMIVGERVLAGFADGKLVSLNLNTGELQWEATVAVARGRTDLERLVDVDGLFGVVGNTAYVSSYQGRIAAVAVDSGSILWSRELSSYTGLYLDEQRIYVSDAESRVWCLDQETGETLWRQDDLLAREISQPVVVGDAVVVADFDGMIHWLASESGQFLARQSLQHIWIRRNMWLYDRDDYVHEHRNISTPPIVDGNRVYVRDRIGVLAALELRGKVSSQ